MISLIYKYSKSNMSLDVNISQYEYDMKNLNRFEVQCSCGCRGSIIKYGTYSRDIIIDDKLVTIRIQRVYCKECGETHALMPVFIIPFDRRPLKYVLELIDILKNEKVNSADYELVKYQKLFKQWEKNLKIINKSFNDEIFDLIVFSAYHFKRMFLQRALNRFKRKFKTAKLFKVDYFSMVLPT